MSDSSQPPISEAERQVLAVLWEQGPIGVREVFSALKTQGQDWTRSTIVTLLQRLVAKGYVGCDKSGYAFVYRPLMSREEMMFARVNALAGELADGEPVPLMLAFAERHRFTAEELARLSKMIEDLKRKSRRK